MQHKHGTANGTDVPGAALLIAALEARGHRPEGGPPQWVARCPVHDDDEPSLVIDVKPSKYEPHDIKLLVYCPVCGRTTDLAAVCEAVGVEQWRAQSGNEVYRSVKPALPRRSLHNRLVTRWHSHLMERRTLLAYLTDERGLTVGTIQEHWLGYDDGLERFTLPVWAEGGLVNVRRYRPGAPPGDKMINVAGYGTPARLYPSLPPSGAVVVCEGEWDALLLRQHGLTAVTSTHGAATFLDDWLPLFVGRHVAMVFDCDTAGRQYAAEHGQRLAAVARSVRVVDLDPHRDDKWDVTDWFCDGRSVSELRCLINRAAPLGVKG